MSCGGRTLLAILFCLVLTQAAPGRDESRLIDQFGQPLDSRALGGHWLLVYFGYASCADVCPSALTRMTAVLDGLGTLQASLDPLFVTLDPAHDSLEVLRAFAGHFHPRLRALTGTSQAVETAARTFNVPWRANASVVDHGTLFYLVAPDGRVVQLLHPDEPTADLIVAIRRHLVAPAS